MSDFNYIQTFYVNPQTVANAPEVMLTSIDVFFKAKPVRGATVSGAVAPTVNAWICEVENDSPFETRQIRNSMTLIEYDLISTSQDASAATVIGFRDPVRLATGRHYGLVLKFNDPAFDVWQNVLGDRLVTDGQITNTLSIGSRGTHGGKLYIPTNTSAHRSLSDRDLKFKVKVARYTASNITISLVNKDYEFFTIDNTNTGVFRGGEYVYQNVATSAAGTITVSPNSLNVVGVGTAFNTLFSNAKILIESGGAKQILSVNSIIDATNMTVAYMPDFAASGITYKVPPVATAYNIDYPKNTVILTDSSANSTNKFANNGARIIGVESGATANIATIDRYPVDNFKPSFLIGNPSGSTFTLDYRIANSANQLSSTATNINLLQMNDSVTTGYILSRSVEVDGANLFGDRKKSVVANLNISVSTAEIDRFTVPYATTRELDFYFYQNDINNVYTETRTVGLSSITNYDTETGSNGLAKSKYVSKVIKFAQDKYAEDIAVYLTGYRPAGTEIKVYAKVHNAADRESFQSKAWTPLVLKDNIDRFSSTDPNDMYEFTYGFDTAPEFQVTLPGTGSITYGSNSITTTSDHTATVTAGDLIRIRDQDFGNHEVFVVSAATSGTIRTYRNIATSSLVSSVSRPTRSDIVIDKLKYRNVAWNNVENDNTVRYVNSQYVEFDRYTSMQIKIVLLATQSHIVPKVEAIQVIGVSA